MLDALGDPTRRRIFDALRPGPRSVGAIAAGMPVSRPAVSQHLRVLLDAGLVSADADGTRRVYRVRAEGLDALRAYVDGFWGDALDRFKDHAEGKGTR